MWVTGLDFSYAALSPTFNVYSCCINIRGNRHVEMKKLDGCSSNHSYPLKNVRCDMMPSTVAPSGLTMARRFLRVSWSEQYISNDEKLILFGLQVTLEQCSYSVAHTGPYCRIALVRGCLLYKKSGMNRMGLALTQLLSWPPGQSLLLQAIMTVTSTGQKDAVVVH